MNFEYCGTTVKSRWSVGIAACDVSSKKKHLRKTEVRGIPLHLLRSTNAAVAKWMAEREETWRHEMDVCHAKSNIQQLFADGKTRYLSDIVTSLELDLDAAIEACKELMKEGALSTNVYRS